MQGYLQQYSSEIFRIYGKALKAVILYGSYARGDYNASSDVDLLILVDLSEQMIQQTREKVSNFTYDFNMEHDLEIMPVVKAVEHFNYWRDVYPFYQNIEKEGVNLYVS